MPITKIDTEKLVNAVKKIPEVYAAGQASMVDESKIIEKTATGKDIVVLNDVSEIPHEVGVNVEAENIFDMSVISSEEGKLSNGITVSYLPNEKCFLLNGSAEKTASYCLTFINLHGKKGSKYTVGNQYISGVINPSGHCVTYFGSSDILGKLINWIAVPMYQEDQFNTKELLHEYITAFWFYIGEGSSFENYKIRVQLTNNESISSFTPYVDISQIKLKIYGDDSTDYSEYTPSVDGTVSSIKSISPNMTFTSDTDGVVIEVDYHKSYGMQTEYDRFWNIYQQYGERTDYQRAFSGGGWTVETFKPKYDIKPTWGGATSMFQLCAFKGNMKKHLNMLGIQFNVSGLVGASSLFYEAKYITELPDMDLRGCTALRTLFVSCYELTSLKLALAEKTTYTAVFDNCAALKNLIIEGTIGQNGFDIHWSKLLNKASITSIINALSTTTSALTITLSLTAVNNALETSAGAADGSESEEWMTLVATRANWTISLIDA